MMLMTYGAEERAAGKYIKTVEDIRRWKQEGGVDDSVMAKIFGIRLPIFQGIVSLIEEHPDWNDETVADNADWR